jgi:predicted DsbA family dithiol-disulfide isomerase
VAGAVGTVRRVTRIDVYADIGCPFAHAGLHTVLRRREELGLRDVAIRVKAWPLELVNDGPVDLQPVVDHVDDLRRQVSVALFSGFDPDTFPTTTLPALALQAAAYQCDDKVGEVMSTALRTALFQEGLDVSDPDVLERIAKAHDISHLLPGDEDAVRAEWHEGEARGVAGSPHFFCGENEVFCPSLDISQQGEDGSLLIRRNMEALDQFLADCFRLD